MTASIVNLIIYAVIAIIVCAIVDHFDKNVNGDECAILGLMWPITVIGFICILLSCIIFDFIKDFCFNKFSKEMKEYKKSETRKLVEDTLIEISNQKNNWHEHFKIS